MKLLPRSNCRNIASAPESCFMSVSAAMVAAAACRSWGQPDYWPAASASIGTGTCAIGAAEAYLPMQKLEKIRPSRSSLVTSPVISPSCFWASVSSCATSSPA